MMRNISTFILISMLVLFYSQQALSIDKIEDKTTTTVNQLAIKGPDLNKDTNKIQVDGPTMPDLKFEITLKGGKAEDYEDYEFHWKFMVEYVVPLTGNNVSKARNGPATEVNGEKDAYLISGKAGDAFPANLTRGTGAYKDYREWFAVKSDYLATDASDLKTTGALEFHLKNDCGTTTPCKAWGNNFGGGFLYATVRVILRDTTDPTQYSVDKWLSWGVGDCKINNCKQTQDYAKRSQLLAVEPGTKSTSLANRNASMLWQYIEDSAITSPYDPSFYAGVTEEKAKEVVKGISERESNTRHFAAGKLGGILRWMKEGMPTVAADGGFGAMQLTLFNNRRPTYSEIWNWQKHIDQAIEFYVGLLTRSATDLTAFNHTPAQEEVMRYTLSKYNGGIGSGYGNWIFQRIDQATLEPIAIPLTNNVFPNKVVNNQAVPTRGLGFPDEGGLRENEPGDFYRDFLMCAHREGPPYYKTVNSAALSLPTPFCSGGSTRGFWQEYEFTDNTFSGTSACISGSSTCYADQRRNGTIHMPVFDDSTSVFDNAENTTVPTLLEINQ